MTTTIELPRDVRNIIFKKLDIETRQKLGIVTKMKNTAGLLKLKTKIGDVLNSRKIVSQTFRHIDGGLMYQSEVEVMPTYIISHSVCGNKVDYDIVYSRDGEPDLFSY
jgi:hypothetical protein